MSSVKYAAWKLTVESEAEAASVPEDVESVSHSEGAVSVESVIGRDDRKLVDREHFMPDGKYRAIVKLFLKYDKAEPGRWSIATGWLIAPDLVVTAGHCAFNWSRSLGRVVKVRAYIGYYGKASTKDLEGNQVQLRSVDSVLTTFEWVDKKSQRTRDVSFFKLVTPFVLDKSKLFKYESTPVSGSEQQLGVVGYPGDLVDSSSKERGAFMYESFETVTYDLRDGPLQMIYYNIDTYGGNSGSAVLRSDFRTSIGVHCYGGTKNHASAIGRYGNSFDDMQRALAIFNGELARPSSNFSIKSATGAASSWLSIVDMDPSQPFEQLKIRSGNGTSPTEDDPNESGSISAGGVDPDLIRTFKTALHHGKSSDFDKTPLGRVGPHLGALAGIALNAAGNFGRPGVETESSEAVLEAGVAERAILAEAAIASIVKLGPKKANEEGLFDIMTKVVKKIGPVVQRVAPKILGAVKDSALQIAISELNGKREPLPDKVESDTVRIQVGEIFNKPATVRSAETEAFADGLLRASGRTESEEFLGFLGPILGAGLNLAKGLIENGDEGLEAVGESSTEADDIDPFKRSPPEFDGLGARAVIGEAALEALIHLGPDKMKEEGLFDVFTKVVKTVGGAVLKHGPTVVSNVLPIISSLANGGGGEGFETGGDGARAESDFLSRLGDEAAESGGGSLNGDFPRRMEVFSGPLKVKYVTRDKVGLKIGEASWETERSGISFPAGQVTLEISQGGSGPIRFPVEELRVSIGKAEAPDWTPPQTFEFTDDSVVAGVLNWDQKESVSNKRIYIEVVGHPPYPLLNQFTINTFVVPDLEVSLFVTPASAFVSS